MTPREIVVVWSCMVMLSACSTAQAPPPDPNSVRQHADKAFQRLKAQETPQEPGDQPASAESLAPAASLPAQMPPDQKGVQIPPAEILPSNDEFIRATGYGNLAKGLFLCQHSADLAARVELSKLVRVTVTERSTDRIRERTGKDAEQDIEVVREGLVNEVLSDARIVDRKVDKEAGTCTSTAQIPRKNLFPAATSAGGKVPGPQ